MSGVDTKGGSTKDAGTKPVVAVVGAGAWGTALAIQANRAGADVSLWARDPARLAGESPHLPGIPLPPAIRVTGTLPEEAALILMAVPMQHMRAVLGRMRPRAPIVLCCKGVETGTLRLPLEIAAEIQADVPAALLTGPNFAREVALGLPAATVAAATDPALRRRIAALLGTPGFRIYGNDDPIGAQIGGAAKNVIAIASGSVIGAGLGENARAALVTRGLAELARLAVALGGRAETVHGLSGLGDLLLTCTGESSRNYSLGFALGRGATLAEVLAGRNSVTEGVATAPALVARAGDVELPICRAVAALVSGRATLREAMDALLARPLRDE
ncbi:MAG TPA: NAD(P)H-dependent glycerol-3-phosphate dehydrogenase [Acetobacteraceae bacterium]|nr:NAD(P)H-dependent glycerol-3-phosphate dehydrogenase [Acetobacteraceae bacterium]